MSSATPSPHPPPPKLRKHAKVLYKELNARKWRSAVVLNVARNGEGVGLLVRIRQSTTKVDDCSIHLVRTPTEEEAADAERLSEWDALLADERIAGIASSTEAAPPAVMPHEPLHVFLRRLGYKAPRVGPKQLRLLTWNVKHYGAAHARPRTRDRDERERLERMRAVHDDERARNLVEVIFQSRAHVVVLQEISAVADLARLCQLLEEREDDETRRKRESAGGAAQQRTATPPQAAAAAALHLHVDVCTGGSRVDVRLTPARWRCTAVVGEHAMLYRAEDLARAVGCESVDELQVECGLYRRAQTLSRRFRAAFDWDGPRFDFGMQGASAARPPALFFACRADDEPHAGRALGLCSVHLAFGKGGKSETRERQLENLGSLMPGPSYEPARCVFALLGDFNSSASVGERGHDFASHAAGADALARINAASRDGHVLALQAGSKTSVGGARYDEVVVHAATLGRRHAHAFPRAEQLPLERLRASLPEEEQAEGAGVAMGFANIFSDHLAVYVDVGV